MGRYSDKELDRILNETMKCTPEPEDSLNEELKDTLALKIEESRSRGISLWWLPGFAGSALTLMTAGLFSFLVSNTAILTLIGIYSFASTICIWGLTIIGVKKYGLIREAVIK